VVFYSIRLQPPNKKDVEEMLWEVDEDLDQCLNWTEFKLMFTRNILDATGLEPARMYNLTQFLIYDHNENGMVSVDETMNMLYARYGRATMEIKLKELFGTFVCFHSLHVIAFILLYTCTYLLIHPSLTNRIKLLLSVTSIGEGLVETGREGGEIDYNKFVSALHKVQMSVFWKTTKGRIIKNKGGLAKKDDDDSLI